MWYRPLRVLSIVLFYRVTACEYWKCVCRYHPHNNACDVISFKFFRSLWRRSWWRLIRNGCRCGHNPAGAGDSSSNERVPPRRGSKRSAIRAGDLTLHKLFSLNLISETAIIVNCGGTGLLVWTTGSQRDGITLQKPLPCREHGWWQGYSCNRRKKSRDFFRKLHQIQNCSTTTPWRD